MSSIEYLYWYEGDELKHFVGTFREIAFTCAENKAAVYFCYSIHMQFILPWYRLGPGFRVTETIKRLEDVPPDIRALHLLIYRGDYGE